jgi:hypothetical protein
MMGEQKKMLILRGNSDTEGKTYPDEKGNKIPWPDGALHEQAAKDYATARGYVGEVLDVSGDPRVWVDKDKKKHLDRDKNPQTFRAPEHKVVPKGLNSHMLGPEWLLSDTPQDKCS